MAFGPLKPVTLLNFKSQFYIKYDHLLEYNFYTNYYSCIFAHG